MGIVPVVRAFTAVADNRQMLAQASRDSAAFEGRIRSLRCRHRRLRLSQLADPPCWSHAARYQFIRGTHREGLFQIQNRIRCASQLLAAAALPAAFVSTRRHLFPN
jgi:hypothetical protein